MEKLIGYLVVIVIIVYIVGIVLSILVSIGLFILGGIAAVGAISGIVVSIQKFIEVLIEAHKNTSYRRATKVLSVFEKIIEPQPSYATYAFDGGWQVMIYVKNNLFTRTQKEAQYWFTQGEKWKTNGQYESNNLKKYYYYSAYAGFQLAGIFQYVFALAVVALFFALQFVVLTTWMTLAIVLMALLAGFNFLYGYYYKIFFRCPECHEQMKIPIYVCPSCATEHTRLWPSAYGIFYHTCSKCETRLPTLDFFGRKEIIQKCTACTSPLNSDIGRLVNVHIPVIGGPNSGKSNFIFMAVNRFIENYAPERSISTSFPDERHQQSYENHLRLLNSGKVLLKTPDVIPQAYNLAVKHPRDRIGHIVYIYDAAGEAYANDINVIQQKPYFDFVHGLIFIIDPFSIDQFVRQHENEIEPIRKALSPSTLSVMDAYERMVVVLEASFGVRKGEKFKAPLAVVVTKTDALDLDGKIGLRAAQEMMKADPSIRLEIDAMDSLVETFLTEKGLGNFIRDVRLHFENPSFFACSSLGRLPDSSDNNPFTPVGVLHPFLWLLDQVNVVKWSEERGVKMDSEHRNLSSGYGNLFKKIKYYLWDSLQPRERQ